MGSIRSYWLQILIAVFLLIGIATGLYLVQRQQIFKPKASNTGYPIGFNVTGLPHYGYGDLFPNTTFADVDTVLQEVQRLGGKVIRVWIANKYISDEDAAERLDRLLTKAQSYNITLLVSFINYYEITGNYSQSAISYYDKSNAPNYDIPLLNARFFREGYKTSYIPFITTVINKNKHHQNIYAWEIGNEIQALDGRLMINFVKDVSEIIKGLDPNRLISTGFLRAAHAMGQGTNTPKLVAQLYSPLDKVDIISVVTYHGDHAGVEDIRWAAQNGKIPIIAEAGFNNDHGIYTEKGRDRSERYEDDMNYWKAQGAKAYLIWAFQPKTFTHSNGNDDNAIGMDNLCHTDYDEIASVIQARTDVEPSYNNAPTTKLVKFDISKNPDFSDSLKVDDVNPEQAFLINYNPVYLREYYGIDVNKPTQCRDRKQVLKSGQGMLLGNTLIQVEF